MFVIEDGNSERTFGRTALCVELLGTYPVEESVSLLLMDATLTERLRGVLSAPAEPGWGTGVGTRAQSTVAKNLEWNTLGLR